MKKLTQALALSVGASLLLTQITDVLINQDKQQALVKSKDNLKISIKQVGKTVIEPSTFTLSSLHTLKDIVSQTKTTGISGIHVEPQNYNIGQAIVFNLHIKIIGNETHDPLPQRQDNI
ncbi:hypothetical protein HMI01_25290 [Halolactibacillus miurensis]|uniref:Uncharacterized protein n=1 Tax=Halolactibacillus miurensis TaxID=306541 RepID=A0A1I6UBR8_9BACI|nr:MULTISPECIES: hypothetical protein [Halolactibacillus]GEM05541.1 hypothetical protein HMI01_25290 [Halolactibacillus miurensis]SFS98737.1 hypothetical protein SAMN05421668_12420 [Halolactibacillus miurensis]